MPDPSRSEELLAHTEWLTKLARGLVREPADAEDAVQDTLVAALAARRQELRSPRAWLARILANRVRKQARGEERRRARESLAAEEDSVTGPAELVERAIAQQELIQAVVALEEPYRSALLQHYFEGLTAEQIARREGTTAANVRQRLSRARRRLRASLSSGAAILLLADVGRPSVLPTAIACACAAALGLAGWLVLAHGSARSAPALGVRSAAPSSPGPSAAASALAESASEPRRESAGISGVMAKVTGSLVVHARRAADGSDAAGTIALARSMDPASPFPIDFVVAADEHGIARFEGMPCVETRVGLLLRGDDYSWVDIRPGQETAVELEIPTGITVAGSVVDEFDSPIADAEIWVSECWQSVYGHVVAKTGPDGRFRVRDVQLDGLNWLGARAAGRAPSIPGAFEGIAPGETVDSQFFRLSELGGALSVSVFDARGTSVDGAIVLAGEESDVAAAGPPKRMATDEKGEARADDLAPGPTQLQVRAAKYGSWRGQIGVAPGTIARLRVVLPDSAVVRGRVEDPAGGPVAGAIVRSFAKGSFLSATTRSGKDGSFCLTGLGEGTIPLTAEDEEGHQARIVLALQAGEEREWSPRLGPVPRIAGTLRRSEGDPSAHTELVLFSGGCSEWEERTELHWVETDAEGRFAWQDLDDAPRTIVATDTAFSFPPVVLRGVRNSVEPIDLRVPDAGFAGTFAVEIVDANGDPVRESGLYVRDLANAHAEILGPPHGGSKLEATAPTGRYALEVRAFGYVRVLLGERSLEAGERIDLGRIVLERGPSFVLAIDGPRVEAPERLVLELRDVRGELAWSTARTWIGGDPMRTLGWARPGRYTVTAKWQGATVSGAIELSREGEAELNLNFGPR